MGKVAKSKEEKILAAASDEKCPRVWEKARRDRMKILFDELSRLLPNVEPGEPPSRPNIIQRAMEHIRELQAQNEDLLKGGFDQVYKNKLDTWKKRVKTLVSRVEQLSDILRTANIHVPSLALESVPTWSHTRPKHWSNKITLSPQQILQKIDKPKSSKKITRNNPQSKENQPNAISPKINKVKKIRKIAKSSESKNMESATADKLLTLSPSSSKSTSGQNNWLPQPGTFILTNGNLLPVLPSSVLTPVIINRPPVLLMQTPLTSQAVPVAAKPPANKLRIRALSRRSLPRRGSGVAHKNKVPANILPANTSKLPAVSPTATFLSSFPVVNTPKISESHEQIPATETNEMSSRIDASSSSVKIETIPNCQEVNIPTTSSTEPVVVSESLVNIGCEAAAITVDQSSNKEEDAPKVTTSETEVVFTLNINGNTENSQRNSEETKFVSSKEQEQVSIDKPSRTDVTVTNSMTVRVREDLTGDELPMSDNQLLTNDKCSNSSNQNENREFSTNTETCIADNNPAPVSGQVITNVSLNFPDVKSDTNISSRNDPESNKLQTAISTEEDSSKMTETETIIKKPEISVPLSVAVSTVVATQTTNNVSTINVSVSPTTISWSAQTTNAPVNQVSTGNVSVSPTTISWSAQTTNAPVNQVSTGNVSVSPTTISWSAQTTNATVNQASTGNVSVSPTKISWSAQTTNAPVNQVSTGNVSVSTTTISWSSALPTLSTTCSTKSTSNQNNWLPLPGIYTSASSSSWRCADGGWNNNSSQPEMWTIPPHNTYTPTTSVHFSNASTFVNSTFGPQPFNDPWPNASQNYTYLGDTYTNNKSDYVSIPNFAVTCPDNSVIFTNTTSINAQNNVKSQKPTVAGNTTSTVTYSNENSHSVAKKTESFYVPPLSEPWCAPTTNKLTNDSCSTSSSISLAFQKEPSFLTSKPSLSGGMTMVNSKIDEPWKTPTFVQSTEHWRITSHSVPFYSSSSSYSINSQPPTTITFNEPAKDQKVASSTSQSVTPRMSSQTNPPPVSSRKVLCTAVSEPERWKSGYVKSAITPITLLSQSEVSWKDSSQITKNDASGPPFLRSTIPTVTKIPPVPDSSYISNSSLPANKSSPQDAKQPTRSSQTFASDTWSNRHTVLPQYPQQDMRFNSLPKQATYQYESFAESSPYLSTFPGPSMPADFKSQYPETKANQDALLPRNKTSTTGSTKNFTHTFASSHSTENQRTAPVTSAQTSLTVSSSSSTQVKPKDIYSLPLDAPKNHYDIYSNSIPNQESFLPGSFQVVPSGITPLQPNMPSDGGNAPANTTDPKVVKKEKKDSNTTANAKIKQIEKPRDQTRLALDKTENADKHSLTDSSGLWSNQYFSQISGNDTPWVDFTVEPRDNRPKPPVNWMTECIETQYNTDDPYQPRYQNVFDRKENSLLDFLNNPLDQDGGKARKKEDLISQDYFGWMSMKVDGLVPSTLPTLVGDLALGNEPTPSKRSKIGHDYQSPPTEKHKMVHEYQQEKQKLAVDYQPITTDKHKLNVDYQPIAAEKHKVGHDYPTVEKTDEHVVQEPFTNLSKNIFEINESSKDAETIVLKNIFELPATQPIKQRTNIGPNSFLSVSQLVEPTQEAIPKTQNYGYYNEVPDKPQNTDWKCPEKKCQQTKSRSNYSAEALLRPEILSLPSAPATYAEYSPHGNTNKPIARQRKQDYYRGQELKSTSSKNRAKKSQEGSFPVPLPGQRFGNPPYGNIATSSTLVTPTTFPYETPLINNLPTNSYSGNPPTRHPNPYPKPGEALYHYSLYSQPATPTAAQHLQNTQRIQQLAKTTETPAIFPQTLPQSCYTRPGGVVRHKHPPTNYPFTLPCANRPQQPSPWSLPPQPPGSSGSSLANFNLTTIFPEMNKKGYQYT